MTFPRRFWLSLLLTMLLVGGLLGAAGRAAANTVVAGSDQLGAASFLVWQRLNQARVNPRQELARLGISEEAARAALGENGWVLDQGVPPLALGEQLWRSATDHARDMVDNLYYSEVSPAGRTLAERVAATGYQALLERETLSALVFQNLVPLDVAVGAMVDTIIRDELTAGPAGRRNIFSPELAEVGVGLLAEGVTLLAGQPYIYLLVIDFATPLAPRPVAVGLVGEGVARVVSRDQLSGQWSELALLPGGYFQMPLSGAGEEIFALDGGNLMIGYATTLGWPPGRNGFLDLRPR